MLSSLLYSAVNARSTEARPVVRFELLAVRNEIQISESTQPLRFVRSSRNDHGPIRSRRLGQVDLLVEPLVGAERRLCTEQIRGDICVLFRGAGRHMSVGSVEDTERELPEHSASEGDNNLIASSLYRSPAQGGENAHRAEPTYNVVAYGYNGRLLRAAERPFESEETRHRCPDFIKSRPVRPRPFLSVKNHGSVDQSGLFCA